jgi:hypothetical protein
MGLLLQKKEGSSESESPKIEEEINSYARSFRGLILSRVGVFKGICE